jgi:hypothetical protein
MLGGGLMRALGVKLRYQRRVWGKRQRKKVVSVSASVPAIGESVMGMMGLVENCCMSVGVVIVRIAMSITGGIILMGRVKLKGNWERSLRAVGCRNVFVVRVERRREKDSRYRMSRTAKVARRRIISSTGRMASRMRGSLSVTVMETRGIVNAHQRGVRVRTVRAAKHNTIDLVWILKSRIDHQIGRGFSVKDG